MTSALVAAVLVLGVAAPGAEPARGPLHLTARVDGRSVARSNDAHPVRLDPGRLTTLDLELANSGARPAVIRTVRLEGRVIGLAFFAYDLSVSIPVEPGATERRRYSLDLGGLAGQATGLVPARVALLDADRREVASQHLVADVRGSLRSVYGLFGLAVAALTVAGFAAVSVALARHRLPANRWRRALRFLPPGVGLGLVVVFTLSALRVSAPRPGRWVPIVAVSAAVLCALGYLTPSPDDDADDDVEPALDATAVGALGP